VLFIVTQGGPGSFRGDPAPANRRISFVMPGFPHACVMLVASPDSSGIRPMSDQQQWRGPAGTGAKSQREQAGIDAADRAVRLACLVGRMASGEQEALARIYDETSSLLNGLLLRMLEYPQDAEEALLDVFMKAWKNAGTYRPERGSVQAWLVIMARTIAIDRIRRKRAQPKTSGLEFDNGVEFLSRAVSPEEQAGDAQRRRKVEAVLRELPPDQREVLEMAFYKGFTHSELARLWGQPLGSVKSRIRTALLRLRDLLKEEGAHA
ncbi:MAG: sigma-70 family RNA polymerase sigma factor, partial [Acidobacteriota bacterium]